MLKIQLWSALLFPLLLPPPLSSAEKKRDIRIVETEGSVWIRQEGRMEWEPVKLDEGFWPAEEGDSIKTGPPPSHALVQMDQDNTIEVGHNSIFEIQSSNFTWSKFKLLSGRILAKIEEKLRDTNRGVDIIMPSGALAVRGTEFAAETSEEGGEKNDAVGVFDGQVEVQLTSLEGSPSVAVDSGNELDLLKSGAAPTPRAIRRFEATRKRMELLRERHKKLRERWTKISAKRRQAIRKRQQLLRERMEKRRQGQ